MTEDLPLCRLGGLDLNLVKRCWGLETCLPIDPLRWKPFEPRHPNYISPVALQVLSCGQDGIKFIEPTVSQQTVVQRQMRQVLYDAASLIYLTIRRVFEILMECLETDTPLPATCRRLHRKASRIPAAWTCDELLNIFILFLWIIFAVAIFGGYVQLAPRERARNWVYTGSFSL
ncbi:hypothetical protein FB45DRAFT_897269 [Roridomyces roridus]|uniref:Uncharacterized protein n=1 Tax=Roridomyces roridus TaxID=1738132 RepID=A0AAD7FX77_9AGAR|nr:hypothetical protein FB45DRAFT_897269 [Roridomyces roridus]